jgi:peptidoglycan/xylan/chitin deacetylase (PgdA/CDA1 family)
MQKTFRKKLPDLRYCLKSFANIGGNMFFVLPYALLLSFIMRTEHRISHPRFRGKLFLTFDDGPSSQYTPELLDLLRKYHIKASFFIVSDFALQNPDIIARMQADGHLIGFHSCCHQYQCFLSAGETRYNMMAGMDALKSLSVEVKYFRPPWGLINLASLYQVKYSGLKTVFWDVMAEDWRACASAEVITYKLRRRTFDGAIICLYDGRGRNNAPYRTLKALEVILPEWLNQGYEFMTVDRYSVSS